MFVSYFGGFQRLGHRQCALGRARGDSGKPKPLTLDPLIIPSGPNGCIIGESLKPMK